MKCDEDGRECPCPYSDFCREVAYDTYEQYCTYVVGRKTVDDAVDAVARPPSGNTWTGVALVVLATVVTVVWLATMVTMAVFYYEFFTN